MVMKLEIGRRFGHLTVIGYGPSRFYGKKHIRIDTSLCRCDCGNIILTTNDCLIRGHRTKCSSKCSLLFRGRYISSNGYVCVFEPNHPAASKRGYVYEHRVIMERHIGRFLNKNEDVHHIDKNRQNNSISNLLLLSRSEHHRLHRTEQTGIISKKKPMCRICGNPTTKEGCLCISCWKKKMKRANIPKKSELEKLLANNSLTKVATSLGISNTTLRRYLIKFGVDYDSRP